MFRDCRWLTNDRQQSKFFSLCSNLSVSRAVENSTRHFRSSETRKHHVGEHKEIIVVIWTLSSEPVVLQCHKPCASDFCPENHQQHIRSKRLVYQPPESVNRSDCTGCAAREGARGRHKRAASFIATMCTRRHSEITWRPRDADARPPLSLARRFWPSVTCRI